MWNGQFDVLNAYGSAFSSEMVFAWLIWDSSTDTYYSAEAVYNESYPNTDYFVGRLITSVRYCYKNSISSKN